MANTSTRMLRLLSLLQTHRYWPGTELSERLEVSPRTLRRDIDRLRDLGYQVDSARGVAGGYQLRAGGSMPPLLLEDEEAVAIAVGLRQAAAGDVRGVEEPSVQALTKVLAIMPPRLRRRIDALRSQTDSAAPYAGPTVDAAVLTSLAQSCRDGECVRFDYTSRGAEATRRHVEPHRLVTIGRKWYLAAYDRERHDWRTFRVDRVDDVDLTGVRFRPREIPGGDAVAYVSAGIRAMPLTHAVRVRVHAPADAVRDALEWWLRSWDGPEADGADCLLTMNTDHLDWPLMLLATLPFDHTVEAPEELRDRVARTAVRLAAAV